MQRLILTGCYLILAFPVLSQGEDLALILQGLGKNCQNVNQINYQSPGLVQPRSGLTFSVSGMLQRRPRKDTISLGNCFPIKAETPAVTLNLSDHRGNIVPLFRHRSTVFFNYVKPVAFSPDGRYLVLQISRSNGIDLYSSMDIIDTERSYLPLYLDICQDSTFGATFSNFVDQTQVKFSCIGESQKEERWDLVRRSKILLE